MAPLRLSGLVVRVALFRVVEKEPQYEDFDIECLGNRYVYLGKRYTYVGLKVEGKSGLESVKLRY
jgi:hypothetical protein